MAWGETIEAIGKNGAGLFEKMGNLITSAVKGTGSILKGTATFGAGIAGHLGRFASWLIEIPARIFSTVLKGLNTKPGAFIATVGLAIAGAVGIKSWFGHRNENKDVYAAQQAEIAAGLQEQLAAKKEQMVAMSQQAGEVNPQGHFRQTVGRSNATTPGMPADPARQPNFSLGNS